MDSRPSSPPRLQPHIEDHAHPSTPSAWTGTRPHRTVLSPKPAPNFVEPTSRRVSSSPDSVSDTDGESPSTKAVNLDTDVKSSQSDSTGQSSSQSVPSSSQSAVPAPPPPTPSVPIVRRAQPFRWTTRLRPGWIASTQQSQGSSSQPTPSTSTRRIISPRIVHPPQDEGARKRGTFVALTSEYSDTEDDEDDEALPDPPKTDYFARLKKRRRF